MAYEGTLAPVLQAAEAINSMRDDRQFQKLRGIYMGKQMQQADASFQAEQQQAARQQQAQDMQVLHRVASEVEASADPVATTRNIVSSPQIAEVFRRMGIDPAKGLDPNATPDIVKHGAAQLRQQIEPFLQQAKPEAYTLSEGQTRFEGGQPVASVAPKPQKTEARFRTLSPEELPRYNLPAGTSAQVNDASGEIKVISKRDNTSTLSQKDSTVAKMKLNTAQLARQQLNNIRERFGRIKGTMSAGAFGQGVVPTEGGRSFDRAVDQMRLTLTALTRVPGVGAMSDYETKLDQARFPTRAEYESVTQQQIDDLDNMLNAIETGYTGLLSGAQPGAQAPQAGARQISSDAEYDALPSGAEFIAPDGSRRRKP